MATKPVYRNMAVAPTQQGVASVGVATSLDGKSAVNTTKVSNTFSGDNELQLSFIAAAGAAIDNLKIKPFAHRTSAQSALPARVTFESNGFDSWDEFVNYFKNISTACVGIRIESADVSNFQSHLLVVEKEPTGKETPVKKLLSKYRVPVGTGYSETIELGEEDFNAVLWSGMELQYSRLQGDSRIDIYLKVAGWNKSQELSQLKSDII